MQDRYQALAHTPLGHLVVGKLGLPDPVRLRRIAPDEPLLPGPAVLGAAAGGRLGQILPETIKALGADVGLVEPQEQEPDSVPRRTTGALVFDATGITETPDLRQLWEFFHPRLRGLADCARVVVLGTAPEAISDDVPQAIAQRALEGFVRSLAKELSRGATAQLVYVTPGAEQNLASTLRFLLSGASAYVSGQVLRVSNANTATVPERDVEPLAGKTAVVTGAARGIGASIVATLARYGAHVVCVDVPAAGADLARVANQAGGSTLQADITAEDAPARLADHMERRFGGLDIIVHNAGITRDKLLRNMTADRWDSVLAVNLLAPQRLTGELLTRKLLRPGARVIGVASMAGIAGNRGQTNYATSKAGVIGFVDQFAPMLTPLGGTVNGVAPGFIETAMTAAMPLVPREVGRRANSVSQGGLPVDVAETIAYFCRPDSAGVTGQVLRVCGQSMLGA